MIGKLKAPRNEEAERQEKMRSDRLEEIAMGMLEAAYERHNDAMERGRYEESNAHSEVASYWWACLNGGCES